MRRLLAMFFVVYTVFSVRISYAEDNTDFQYKICWVTETISSDTGIPTGRSISVYDPRTGETNEETISLSWIPLEGNRLDEGLFFYVEKEHTDDKVVIEILRWNPEAVETISENVEIRSGSFPWIYQGGILYVLTRESIDTNQESDGMVRYVEATGLYETVYRAGSYRNNIQVLSRDSKLYNIQVRLDDMDYFMIRNEYDDGEIELSPGYDGDWEYDLAPYSSFCTGLSFVVCNLTNRMYYWAQISNEYIPSILIENEAYNACDYKIPFHYYVQLMELDLQTGVYKPYTTTQGEKIILEDKYLIAGKMKIAPLDDCLFVKVRDNSPVSEYYEDCAWLYEGTTYLLQISLHTGEITVLKEAGFAAADYSALYNILISTHSRMYYNDSIMRYEDLKEYSDEIVGVFEERFLPGENEDTYEMLPANFSIACIR